MKKKKSIQSNRGTRRALITRDQPRSPISEQFKTIRTNIQYAALDHDVQIVMGTSANPGDGKTTVNANLAVTMSQQDARVLLIDADLRKPALHYTFEVPNVYGLSSIVTKQKTLVEAIQATNVETLDILTSGPVPPNPSEMLSSKLMTSILNEARTLYDYIVIDTPPVLAVSDAQIVAGLSDGIMIVLKSGVTETDDASQAVEVLKHTGTKILGAILNHKQRDSKSYHYYYGS
ncbi:capsular biosynthesis protein [Bacillaceae bacterium JMAK1]|nr:capsular biosynthesis protein [Bacillaceae bacterium JMAK1]